jgi:hypothetical protein
MGRCAGPVCALMLALASTSPASSATAAALAPHVAAYRLSLADAATSGSLVQVDGGLVIEWRQACDGWLSHQRLGFVATTDAGMGFTHDVRFSSWEALDGDELRYSVRSFDGDQIDEEYRGEADRATDGSEARFRVPEDRTVDLPADTVFPTDHLRRVLESAVAGERFVSHAVFDGWGYDALTQITSVIGQPRELEAADDPEGTGEARVWPVSMAYYPGREGGDVPEFEATFLLDEQGVLRNLVLDYGDFGLEAELVELDLLDPPDC